MKQLREILRTVGFSMAGSIVCGCVSAPAAQLSAADSMDLVAASLRQAIDEYRLDLDQLDDERRRAVVEAFVTRVRTDHQDEKALASHTALFTSALDRIDADRRTASDRRQNAVESLESLQEVADGLRRLAVESMSLDDEARRYLGGLIAQSRAAHTSPSGENNAVAKRK